MIIVYAPEGGEQEHYDARKLKVSEASIVQRTIDKTFAEVRQGVQEEDPEVLRGVAWVLKKRSNPSLRFGEFDPGIEELWVRMDKQEVEGWVNGAIAVAAENPDATPDMIRESLSDLPLLAFDPEHAAALIEKATEGETPKDGPAHEPSPAESNLSPT